MTTPAAGHERRDDADVTTRPIKATRAQKIAAQYLVELAEKEGRVVRPAYRAIANAK